MNGVDESFFDGNGNLTRGQQANVLKNLYEKGYLLTKEKREQLEQLTTIEDRIKNLESINSFYIKQIDELKTNNAKLEQEVQALIQTQTQNKHNQSPNYNKSQMLNQNKVWRMLTAFK